MDNNKLDFISGSFFMMLQELDNNIIDIDYSIDNVSNDEILTIIYDNGSYKKVNISADNNKAIVIDVLKHI